MTRTSRVQTSSLQQLALGVCCLQVLGVVWEAWCRFVPASRARRDLLDKVGLYRRQRLQAVGFLAWHQHAGRQVLLRQKLEQVRTCGDAFLVVLAAAVLSAMGYTSSNAIWQAFKAWQGVSDVSLCISCHWQLL
jgi:hypothetical protein